MDSPLITAHDLRLLSIGYYIQAGIAAFYTVMLVGYSAFIAVLLTNLARVSQQGSQQNIPPAVLSILSVVLTVVIGMVCAYTACLFLAGFWLRRLRNKLFIEIVAAFNCLGIPYGTVLSIFTFMVLQRPSAKQLFAGGGMPPPIPAPPSVAPSGAPAD
jgi:ABC-type branched-subunit amino acid transport system permease subunit